MQSLSATLVSCFSYCTRESQYLGTIISGNSSPPRTFNYEIIDEGNDNKTLIIDTPEGNRAAHGNYILSLKKFHKKKHCYVSQPCKKEIVF